MLDLYNSFTEREGRNGFKAIVGVTLWGSYWRAECSHTHRSEKAAYVCSEHLKASVQRKASA